MSEKTIEELREEAERAELEKRIRDAKSSHNTQENSVNSGIVFILIVLIGYLGVHWFYMGRTKMGLLYLFSFFFIPLLMNSMNLLFYMFGYATLLFFIPPIILGVGLLVDFFRFIFGGIFIDGNGYEVKLY